MIRRGVAKRRGSPETDYFDPAAIRADRHALNAIAAPVLVYANRLIAHRTRLEQPLNVTVDQINASIDAFEQPFTKSTSLSRGALSKESNPTMSATTGKRPYIPLA